MVREEQALAKARKHATELAQSRKETKSLSAAPALAAKPAAAAPRRPPPTAGMRWALKSRSLWRRVSQINLVSLFSGKFSANCPELCRTWGRCIWRDGIKRR